MSGQAPETQARAGRCPIGAPSDGKEVSPTRRALAKRVRGGAALGPLEEQERRSAEARSEAKEKTAAAGKLVSTAGAARRAGAGSPQKTGRSVQHKSSDIAGLQHGVKPGKEVGAAQVEVGRALRVKGGANGEAQGAQLSRDRSSCKADLDKVQAEGQARRGHDRVHREAFLMSSRGLANSRK